MSGSESEPAARSRRQVGAGLLSTERTSNRGSKLACEGGIQADKDASDALASSRASSLPQGQCQGQNRNQPPDHRGRSVQGCYLPNEHQTVGASLLAKAVFKPIKMHRMYWPLREQARLPQGQCQGQNRNQPPDHGGRSVQGCYLQNEHQTVGASLLAKAVFKPIKMHRMYRPLREQARSHRVRINPRSRFFIVIDGQLIERRSPAFGGIPGVVLGINPGLEVQQFVFPACIQLGVPDIIRGVD